MRKLLLGLFLTVGVGLFAQSNPPAPSAGHWIIVDTTYQVGTSALGTTQADLYYENNLNEKITGMQFRVFYDKVAFSGAAPTVAALYSTSDQYVQYVTDTANGHITVTTAYTGSNTNFSYADGASFRITFTHAPAATWNTLAGIDSLKITGTQTFTNLAATNLGNDTTLTLYSYGGAFEQQTLTFNGRFLTTAGDGAEKVWLSLDKKPKAGSTWTTVNTYSTDSTGRFAFTETLDTTYWDTRISVQGDTLSIGNVLSTADAQRINQSVLGQWTPTGFDFYTMNVNGGNGITITDAYSVFSRLAGGISSWPNGVEDVLFFTDTEFSSIDGSATDLSSSIPGVTNFTHKINGGPDSVTYYVAVIGDANATGFQMARLTPIKIVNPNNAPNYIIDQTVDYKKELDEIEINFPNLTVDAGNLVNVPVKVLSGTEELSALQLNVRYDESLLQFQNVVNSSKVMNWLSFFDPSDGNVHWGGADFGNENHLVDGDVAFTLQFTALEPQLNWTTSPLWVAEKYVGDNNATDMNISPTDGRVEVRKRDFDPGAVSGFNITTFPNPTPGYTALQFSVEQDSDLELSIFDMTGRKLVQVLNENVPSGQYLYEVDLSNLSNGVYYASILTSYGVTSTRIVILK